jgi:hypothetical protein
MGVPAKDVSVTAPWVRIPFSPRASQGKSPQALAVGDTALQALAVRAPE